MAFNPKMNCIFALPTPEKMILSVRESLVAKSSQRQSGLVHVTHALFWIVAKKGTGAL